MDQSKYFIHRKFFTYGADEQKRVGEDIKHGLETILDFLFAWNTGRVNVINTRADLVGVSITFEGVEEFHVTLGGLDGNDISIKMLDEREDVIKVKVAEVRLSLKLVGDTSGGKLKRIDSPFKIGIPIRAAKRQLRYFPSK